MPRSSATGPRRADSEGVSPSQAVLVRSLTEAQLQRHVVALAETLGWLCYHTHDSRRSNAGFPDLIALRLGSMVVIEFKSEQGKVTSEQARWLREFSLVTFGFVGVIRPSDWYAGRVDEVLR